MRNRRNELTETIILILLALLCAVVAWKQEQWGDVVRICFMLAGVIFLVMAIFAAVLWIEYKIAIVQEARNRAGQWSERVALLNQIGQMNDSQLALVNNYVPVLELIAGDGGPAIYLRVGQGELVPRVFLEKYINLGTQSEFYPIRNLTSKNEQGWAMQFISYAVMMGWAQNPAGNQPAKWLDYNRAINSIWGA